MSESRPEGQSARFLGLYALAVAGGSASYAPFLTIILPLKATEIAAANAIQLLSYTAFAGAIAASLSNLFFGWASDRTHNRTGWIIAGVALSCGLLISMRFARTAPELVLMICAWQVSLNMMLGPLAAWAGDCIPDHQKGLLGGLLSLAPGVGALTGAFATIPGLADGEERLILIAVLVSALILPVIIFGRPRPMPALMQEKTAASPRDLPAGARLTPLVPVWRMWLARLLVQIAEAALFAFLLLWLREIDGRITDNNVATIFSVVLFGSVPLAIFAGRWSDREGRPIFPLVVAIVGAALGLLMMAGSETAWWGVAGYCVFGTAAAVFLALHTSQTLRVLPKPKHRGRDLGIFNLTNTIPSMIMPGLTLALIPHFGFRALFFILALLVAASAMLLATRRLRAIDSASQPGS